MIRMPNLSRPLPWFQGSIIVELAKLPRGLFPPLKESPMPSLFTPFTLKDITLKNSIAVSPMCQYSAQKAAWTLSPPCAYWLERHRAA